MNDYITPYLEHIIEMYNHKYGLPEILDFTIKLSFYDKTMYDIERNYFIPFVEFIKNITNQELY